MRARLLNMPAIGRAAGFAAVAAAIITTAVHIRHQTKAPAVAGGAAPVHGDPLTQALARCQVIGSAAQDDPACLAAWAENRRRFFSYRPSTPVSPSPVVAQATIAAR